MLENTLPPFRAALAKRCRRPEAYAASVLGFCLVRYAVRAVSPEADTENWACNGCGKPHLAAEGAPHFNLSHSGRLIAVAVGDSEVGVDVEQVKPRKVEFAKKYCSEEEQKLFTKAADFDSELTRLWSAKEARVKHTGSGLSGALLRDIPTIGVENVKISLGESDFWLSLCPADKFDLAWVKASELY
jgi:4'-phosphopantetheinyl transferase